MDHVWHRRLWDICRNFGVDLRRQRISSNREDNKMFNGILCGYRLDYGHSR